MPVPTPVPPPTKSALPLPGRLAPAWRAAGIVLAGGAAWWASTMTGEHLVSAPQDLVPAPVAEAVAEAPHFRQSWLTPVGHTPLVHCSGVTRLPSGGLLAYWYGGTREGAADVAVFTSRLDEATGRWSPPARVIDRAQAEDELDRRIKKVGNAVIFPDQIGNLWLVYASVSLGGWSGCALNIMSSQDEGRTWGPSRRLTLNPFFNISSLVRNKPIYASDGRIGLPVYHEMATKYPQILWFKPGPGGALSDYKMRSLTGAEDLIQPSLVSLGDDRVLMMLRDAGAARALHTAYSDDNGWTWSEAKPSTLPNPNAAVDGLRLRDGRILLVYNHAEHGRENLQLAVSSDDGRTWQPKAVFEQEPKREFSYPQLAQDEAGHIHLTYTWRRERIRHVSFNTAWLDQAAPGKLAGMH